MLISVMFCREHRPVLLNLTKKSLEINLEVDSNILSFDISNKPPGTIEFLFMGEGDYIAVPVFWNDAETEMINTKSQ